MHLGRAAHGKAAVGDHRTIGQHTASGHRAVRSDTRHRHEAGGIADHRIMTDEGLDRAAVPDHHIILDMGRGVEDRVFLDMDIVADADRRGVRPDHHIRPDRAIVTDHDIADQDHAVGDHAVLADGRQLSVEWIDLHGFVSLRETMTNERSKPTQPATPGRSHGFISLSNWLP